MDRNSFIGTVLALDNSINHLFQYLWLSFNFPILLRKGKRWLTIYVHCKFRKLYTVFNYKQPPDKQLALEASKS